MNYITEPYFNFTKAMMEKFLSLLKGAGNANKQKKKDYTNTVEHQLFINSHIQNKVLQSCPSPTCSYASFYLLFQFIEKRVFYKYLLVKKNKTKQ